MKRGSLEVEVRSFVNDNEYKQILSDLKLSAEFVSEIKEETVYFSAKKDLRLRRNGKDAFLILKEGKLHDDHRKECEIKFSISEFDSMIEVFQSLGHKIQIKWFRKRMIFKKGDVKLLLDDTKGYGKIFEIEKIVEPGKEKFAHKEIKGILESYGIKITEKEKLDQAYEYYKNNWQTLIK